MLQHLLDERIDLLLLANVAYTSLDQSTLTKSHGFEQWLFATATHDNPRTATRKLQRHLTSKATAPAADDR